MQKSILVLLVLKCDIRPVKQRELNLKVLKDVRIMRKMKIKDLSKKTGINHDRISLIERGLVNPSFDTVVRLAEGLNVQLVIAL